MLELPVGGSQEEVDVPARSSGNTEKGKRSPGWEKVTASQTSFPRVSRTISFIRRPPANGLETSLPFFFKAESLLTVKMTSFRLVYPLGCTVLEPRLSEDLINLLNAL
ncbi:hypothetical protein BaRGS_00017221 [Batillaria attramentaria]|uniref:Uncharacterized protein n=1 Tax=Batillaria attramentaria TaxID=370345 RepID=A0ABD0KWI2_9CAEN